MAADVRTSPPPLRGRGREWAQVVAALDKAGQGHRTVLVIEGPSGAGKTRLLQDLIALARVRLCPILEHDGWLTTSLIRQTGADQAWLADQLPRLPAGTPAVMAWDDARYRGRVNTPVLRAFGPSEPILFALTGCAGSSIAHLPDASVIVELGPLSESAVADMMADLLAATPNADLLALADAAAANPGAVVDLVDGLAEDGLIAVEGGVARLTSPALPRRIGARLRRQLAQVSPQTRQLVRVASTVGLSFTLLDLASLMRDTAAGLLPAIEEALWSGLFVSDGERLTFGHELVRSAVAESLPISVRNALRLEADRRLVSLSAACDERPDDGWHSLSPTDRTIARLVGQAMTNREIAARLFLSPHTVNYHLRQIFKKLNIHSRVDLVRITQAHSEGDEVKQAS